MREIDLGAFMKTTCGFFAGLLLGLGASTAGAAEVAVGKSSGTLPEGLPFSEVIRVNDTYYLSGQIGVASGEMKLVPGGIEAETRQTLENIRAVLQANDLDLQHVVKCLVMLADMDDWGAFNTIYASYFKPPYPTRSAIGANGLALGARVELECMAVRRLR